MFPPQLIESMTSRRHDIDGGVQVRVCTPKGAEPARPKSWRTGADQKSACGGVRMAAFRISRNSRMEATEGVSVACHMFRMVLYFKARWHSSPINGSMHAVMLHVACRASQCRHAACTQAPASIPQVWSVRGKRSEAPSPFMWRFSAHMRSSEFCSTPHPSNLGRRGGAKARNCLDGPLAPGCRQDQMVDPAAPIWRIWAFGVDKDCAVGFSCGMIWPSGWKPMAR